MTLTTAQLRELLRQMDLTEAQEIDCEEFLHRVAAYVERLDAHDKTPTGFEDRVLLLHMQLCPECLEEFEALMALMGGNL